LFYLGFFGHSFCERPRAVVFYRVFLRVPTVGPACWRRKLMNGYISQRRGRFYVVIYEGRDPVTGKELWRWHPAGSDRAEAERLAKKLTGRGDPSGRSDPVVDLRCVPHEPVAAGQEAAPRDQHLQGV
jgi:hypothetical protein